MNSCVGADVNGDKRMDLVCAGAGGVLRWYENKGRCGAERRRSWPIVLRHFRLQTLSRAVRVPHRKSSTSCIGFAHEALVER
jgi:hypothetical protein